MSLQAAFLEVSEESFKVTALGVVRVEAFVMAFESFRVEHIRIVKHSIVGEYTLGYSYSYEAYRVEPLYQLDSK